MTRKIYDKVRADLNNTKCPKYISVYLPWALKNLKISEDAKKWIKYEYSLWHIEDFFATKNIVAVSWMQPITINNECVYRYVTSHIPYKHIKYISY